MNTNPPTPLRNTLESTTFNHLPHKDYSLWKEEYRQNVRSYNIPLALAFNMALKNYEAVRNTRALRPLKMNREGVLLLEFFRNKYDHLEMEVKKNDSNVLEEFSNWEWKVFCVVDKLRNYHSHYIHETGAISFRDLFDKATYPKKKLLSTEEYTEVVTWMEKKFRQAKTHMLDSLTERAKRIKDQPNPLTKQDKKRIEDIAKVTEKLESFNFYHGENEAREISFVGRLFIACMFLRKSEASVVLGKWTGIKRTEGDFKSLNTFFNHYSLKDSYSLLQDHQDLRAFRSIVSQLSTLPHIEHPDFIPVYDFITLQNKRVVEQIRLTESKLKGKRGKVREELIQTCDALKRSLIPIRKRRNATTWMLRYLEDNGMLEGFQIACAKHIKDRDEYLEKAELLGVSLVKLKNRIKLLDKDSEERQQLKVYYAEIKRNFQYKNPGETGYQYITKLKNALLRFEHDGEKINVTISPSLLTKWVFICLQNPEKGRTAAGKIKGFIIHYRSLLKRNLNLPQNISQQFKLSNLTVTKALPHSLLTFIENEDSIKSMDAATDSEVQHKVACRLKELSDFKEINSHQPYPWRYASKRKIDIILDYAHFHYRKRFLQEANRSEDEARRESPREAAYLQAYNYIRFFRQYKGLPDFSLFFFEEYKNYYAGIKELFSKSERLEDLFNNVIEKYINELKAIVVTETNREVYARLFRSKGPSTVTNVKENIKASFINNISIPPALISIKEILLDEWSEFEKRKTVEFQAKNKPSYVSEFSFIRDMLNKQNPIATNTDFLIQKVLLPQKDRWAKKSNGTWTKGIFDALFKLKTEELLLWSIAKYYWKRAYNVDYAYTHLRVNPNEVSDIYMDNFFARVYDFPIRVKMVAKVQKRGKEEDKKTEEKDKPRRINFPGVPEGSYPYEVVISPRKLDNEFLYNTSLYFGGYYLWFVMGKTGHNKPLDFIETLKKVKGELKNNIDDTYSILCLEKYFVDNNLDWAKKEMELRYGKIPDDSLNNFYLPFDTILPFFEALITGDKSEEHRKLVEYVKDFRDFAIHYQLQNPDQSKKIRALLDAELERIGKNLPAKKSSDGSSTKSTKTGGKGKKHFYSNYKKK